MMTWISGNLLMALMISFTSPSLVGGSRPNILIMVVDDLGIGDIGCFGNTSLSTPHIDRLCREGSKLSHHLASATLCTPSRAALLTGRYAVRMGMAGEEMSSRVVQYSSGRAGLPSNETTFADIARSNGYRTGMVGKWHLGFNEKRWGDQVHGPLGHGFDYFYGLPFTLCDGFEMEVSLFTFGKAVEHGTELSLVLLCLIPLRFFVGRKVFFTLLLLALFMAWFVLEHFTIGNVWWSHSLYMEKFINSYLMENNEVVQKPVELESLANNLISKSVTFMEESIKTGGPFLLYHSFAHVHTPLATDQQFKGLSSHGPYGDTVMELDHSVGLLLATLDKLNVQDNTFVYFTSDHGGDQPQIGAQGGFNGQFRGGKSNGALEGGMRVPGIVRWPAVIRPGSEVTQPTGLMDVLPTVAQISGDTRISDSNNVDGVSFLKFLTDGNLTSRRTIFHHCASDVFAVRTSLEDGRVFKMILKEPLLNPDGACESNLCKPVCMCPCYGPLVRINEKPLLYDIVKDPTESNEIDSSSQLYWKMHHLMMTDLVQFRNEVEETKMPSQYSSFWRMMPHPQLQPFLNVQTGA